MFTGIVAAIGEVRSIRAIGAGRDMRVVVGVPAGPAPLSGAQQAGVTQAGVTQAGVTQAGGLLFLPAVSAGGAGAAEQARGCAAALREMLGTAGVGLDALVRCRAAVVTGGPDAGAALREVGEVLMAALTGAAAPGPAGAAAVVPSLIGVAALPGGALVQVEAVAGASGGAGGFLSGVVPGASIACSGCCLTVVEFGADWFAVEASAETLSLTTLGRWAAGTKVNLERALRLGDELGGHMVSGHVDGLGEVVSRAAENGSLRLEVALPRALARLVVTKGSVAVDGVSLTVNTVRDGDDGAVFGVNVIPHTAAATTLGLRRRGEAVHIEVDGAMRQAQREW